MSNTRSFGTLKKRPERLVAYTNPDAGTFVVPAGQEHIYFVYFKPTDADRFGEMRVSRQHRDTLEVLNSHLGLIQRIVDAGGELKIETDSVTFFGVVYNKTDDHFELDPDRIDPYRFPGDV